ncbi:MAG: thermonuclease family protein [Deltaproteobacteria bacterium]|nr:thermonuclease family protein [Deltaproteobacteria bacterium]MCW5806124.1 thermonuclease family protein [Deltaproteobacteria bacterium]
MRRLALSVLLAAIALGCGNHGSDRYSRKQAQKSLSKLEVPGTTVGEFKVTKVTDGDTVHVDGLDSSLRLVGIDTEETFKTEPDRRDYEAGWEQYLVKKRGASKRPVKMSTPFGDTAKKFAVKFFDGVDRVRLERDHPAEIRDRYKRYLAYVIAHKDGKWINYNVEAVRAGMTPYFTKYGYSRKYHSDFLAAQHEAQKARRGIWGDADQHYPDYPERLAWWNARGEFVEEFRKEGEGKDNYIDITHWDAQKRIEELLGKEIHVLGTIDGAEIGQKGPSRAEMKGSKSFEFPLIFFDNDVFGTSGVREWKGEYVVVTGVPTVYENKRTHRKQVQIRVERASQIKLSKVPGLTPPTVP